MQRGQVNASEDSRGNVAVRKFGPGGFVVGLDGRPVFSERLLEAEEGIAVAVGEVMHKLAHGPAAFAIGRVQLGIVQPGNGGAKGSRQIAQNLESVRRDACSDRKDSKSEAANRMTKISRSVIAELMRSIRQSGILRAGQLMQDWLIVTNNRRPLPKKFCDHYIFL